MGMSLNPLDCGWKVDDDKLIPIMTDEVHTPDELLTVIRCNCQLSSTNTCDGNCAPLVLMDSCVLWRVVIVGACTVKIVNK